MSLVTDSGTTSITTTPQPSTSTLHSSASTVIVTCRGRRKDQGSSGVTATPVISATHKETVVKGARDHVIAETLSTCGFHDSSSRLKLAEDALTDTCSFIFNDEHSIKLWVDANISTLYRSIITPMSTILNCFKKCTQDIVENLYDLEMSIWTDTAVQAEHNKTTIKFLIGQSSLNFIFGDTVRVNMFL
ncbi:hypothetical protein BDR07DRAFT_1376191 [Suillus spraguei]|nr:hypothetical protein BDR07DRAFT_1376191 [Suillus spraguei]